jgi:site-specific recombinase XerC
VYACVGVHGQLSKVAADIVPGANPAPKRAETVSEAAERIFKEGVGEVRDVVNDPIRFRKHVAPHIGKLPVTDVGSSHIREVLNSGKEQGKSHKSLVHLRRVMNLIFGLLWQDEEIRENPVARVKVPKVETDKRERSVLTDAELVRYLGWQHPEEHHGMAVLERQTMACISRCFGGLRTGDMHALRWSRWTPPTARLRSAGHRAKRRRARSCSRSPKCSGR